MLSPYQKAIVDHSIEQMNNISSHQNVVNTEVQATAGSGKSFLLSKICEEAYYKFELNEIKALSFVRLSVADLRKKFKAFMEKPDAKMINTVCSTFNSLGLELYEDALKIWNETFPERKCNFFNVLTQHKYLFLVDQASDELGWDYQLMKKSNVRALVDRLREQVIIQPKLGQLQEVAAKFNIQHQLENDEQWEQLLKLCQTVIIFGLKQANPHFTNAPTADWIDHCLIPFLLAKSKNPNSVVYTHFKESVERWRDRNRILLVDEVQDINPILLNMIEGLDSPGNYVVIVGDKSQNLYHWRGAAVDGMDQLAKAISAKRFTLPITYRLPLNHVQMIKEIWPNKAMQPHHETLGQLSILQASNADASYLFELSDILQDASLSKLLVGRKNSSVVKIALKLITFGYEVKISNLVTDARKYAKQVLGCYSRRDSVSYPDNPDLIYEWIETWKNRTIVKLRDNNAKPAELQQIHDWAEVLVAICIGNETFGEGSPTSWEELSDRIGKLSSKKKKAIQMSTIHSAKGQEAEVVIFCDPCACPLQWTNQSAVEYEQEMNALFVALSRAKLSDNPKSGHLILLSETERDFLTGWMKTFDSFAKASKSTEVIAA